jgi:uncharacterized protein YxeA
MNYINFILIILVILIIILVIIYYKNKNIEKFNDFSPYINNQTYPYVYQKNLDNVLLQRTLKKWEDPFNTHDEGYYNAEPNKGPPLVPLYSYEDMREVKFPVYNV